MNNQNWQHDKISGIYTAPNGEKFLLSSKGARATELQEELQDFILAGGTIEETTIIASVKFLGRFTPQEMGGFYTAAAAGDIQAMIFKDMLLVAGTKVNLLSNEMQQFAAWFEAQPYSSKGRAAEILAIT